ncbi:Glycoside hydrolase, family 3 [Cordyceps fumosorosea ARSEF 2679]|uniref:Glycoside hydrolase, family 3 n=1 Tax=Cordyceps fumosorosea (strain ARSEF 2679) TaxID=1081104 RepID=A0A167N564_CORFA|nr:Glycoside hydrolase, family 3 [Cordyceps fumosorosea ARSEF 2679]OAA55139.1 Glycoside hydrolase, family 3 [Cordyceps fumosorosea ARSEF 2679]
MVSTEQRKKVGQLFAVGFHGTAVDDNIKSLIQDYGVGAVVLFKRNVSSAAQLRALCHDLQALARAADHPRPLLIGIDQENGLVTRLSPPVAAQQPGPMTLAAAVASSDAAAQVAAATAETLRHFGINVNYAPVADVNSEPLNPVIGVRSPSDDPHQVARLAAACAAGLRAGGVVPCAKHFPGHGDTAVDSHYGLPSIDKTRARLDETELVPFARAAREGVEMVMTAHIALPRLTGTQTPATLAPEVLGILRGEMRFEGVIVTDCLEMDGIRATYGTVEGALLALKAGVDSVMICHTYEVQAAAVDRVCSAIEKGEISQPRIDESLARLDKLKDKFTSWEQALQTSTDEALAEINARGAKLARKIYSDAVTVVRSEDGLLPTSPAVKTVFVSPGPDFPVGGGAVNSGDAAHPTRVPWVSSSFGDEIRKHCAGAEEIRYTEKQPLTDEEWAKVEAADVVILATRNAREAPYQQRLGLEIARRRGNRPLISVATCAPYDFLDEAAVRNLIVVYEPTLEAFRSAVDVIYGIDTPRGKLPVAHKKN